jgi:cytochrome c-type biogenesis protein CcmH
MQKLWLIVFLSLSCLQTSFAEAYQRYPFNNEQDQARFQLLTKEIRCLVCQNQNLDESNAPLANDLRNKIYTMVQQGTSNQDIKTYLVARFGDYILLNPPLKPTTMLLWCFPLFAIILSLLIIWQFTRNRVTNIAKIK